MTAEIINIGDELLIGQVINTNGSWMAEQLRLSGIDTQRITIIPDEKESILLSLREAVERSDVIMLTGGLGPTRDDITKDALAGFFNCGMVESNEVLDDIRRLFSQNRWTISALNARQALVPESCIPIRNNNGTAPGMWFEKDGKCIVSMPGVPFEMKPMLTDQVIPMILGKYKTGALIHKTIHTIGVPESKLAEMLESWEDRLPGNMKLAYLPQPGMVRLRLSASGIEREAVEKQIEEQIKLLLGYLPDQIFAYNEDTLPLILGRMLLERKQTVATAESCTGGYLAHLITSVPGSSGYYLGSMVAYSNRVKKNLLGVDGHLLENFGAVSRETVVSMAENARIKFGADFSIATSGIAGPDGGTPDKPVGTTWIAVASDKACVAKHFLFGNHRERNIHKTALFGLNMLRRLLLNI
ncbi:MAG: competence/damage-inducible protein A [Bacteroidales bacterium]|nr:competence/damage-inducible protein A [Bacteroidales bacterium]